MTIQLKNFITNVLAMPHYSNDMAGSGTKFNSHEDALASELVKAGYTEVAANNFKKLRRKKLHEAIESTNRQNDLEILVPGLANGSFIRQPANSQAFPDFLVKDFSGTLVVIEAKSTSSSHPAWNDSLPKNDAIYIFSSSQYQGNTVFLGQDVLARARYELLMEIEKKIKSNLKDYQELIKNFPDETDRGFTLDYVRSKFNQTGGKAKINYFEHKDRQKCENNVLLFAENQ